MYVIRSKEENLSMVELLLDAGACVNRSVVRHITCSCHYILILFLPQEEVCPLTLTCYCGHINIARLLIKRGADIDICREVTNIEKPVQLLKLLFMKDCDGHVWTPLNAAANKRHHEICQVLLEHGAVLEVPDGKV